MYDARNLRQAGLGCRCRHPYRDAKRDAERCEGAATPVTFTCIPEYEQCFKPLLEIESLAQVRSFYPQV